MEYIGKWPINGTHNSVAHNIKDIATKSYQRDDTKHMRRNAWNMGGGAVGVLESFSRIQSHQGNA